MAEQVQAALDQMVGPLADLQERNVFTPEEIHAIVDRRRQSEYLLRRIQVRKEDFLRYIEAETQLESLRKLRMKRLQRENKDKKKQEQEITKHLGDRHIMQLIHLLWKRAFRKFRADHSLYLKYAEFLKAEKNLNKLSELYASVLQIFPKESGWWVEAASHEYFVSGSLQTARVLLQRGLRMNPKSVELWLQSFTLELHFVQKMTGRRQILLGKDHDDKTTDQLQIARLVHDNAIAAFPNDDPKSVSMRLQFLQQCEQFPNTHELKKHILDALQRDCCKDSPMAWIAAARGQMELQAEPVGFLENEAEEEEVAAAAAPPAKKQKRDSKEVEGKDPILTLMRKATMEIKTAEMYLHAVRLLSSYLDHLSETQDGKDESDEANQKMRACQHLLEKLLKEANQLSDYSADISLEHVQFFLRLGRPEAAISKLGQCAKTSTKAVIWRKWASLTYQHSQKQPAQKAVQILSQGLEKIPIKESADYMHLLLELLGVKLSVSANDLWGVMQRILLLAPGCNDIDYVTEPEFGVCSVADACLQYLHYLITTKGIKEVRNMYEALLFTSSLLDNIRSEKDAAYYKEFIDATIQAEKDAASKDAARPRLERLFESAIQAFKGTPLEFDYITRRDEEVRYGIAKETLLDGFFAPTLDASSADFSASRVSEVYQKYQFVHIKHTARRSSSQMTWREIFPLFQSLNAADKDSWCIEQDDSGNDQSPASFLKPFLALNRAYCSFLVQKDHDAYDKVLKDQLPFVEFPGTDWCYERALWVFFGRNPSGSADLPGRPNHTDSVSHDGTFHWQLSGTKIWHLHPSRELVERQDHGLTMETGITIPCQQGDIIILNTRLWFHRTVIPSQHMPSVSYARDFRLTAANEDDETSDCMTNVDGLYATDRIAGGTIVFTEHDMPDCELHRSSENPNCEVAELEDGTSAVVSIREIQAGEFFCVPESSDDDEDAEDEEETDF